MIDAMMALVITTLGVLAFLSLMPQGWTSSRSSDERSRATTIMHREFENVQALLSNQCNPQPGAFFTKTVNSSGQTTAIAGDQQFTVNKWYAAAGIAPDNLAVWTVTVQVLWPGTTTGVRDSHMVKQQDDYAFPATSGFPHPNCKSFVFTGSYN